MTRFTSFVNILRNWFGSCSCLVIQKLAGLFLKTSFSQIFLLAAKQRFVKLNKRTSTAQTRSSAVRPSHHRRPAPCAPIAGRGGAGAAAAPSQDGGVRAGDEAGLQAPRRPRRRPRRHLAAAQVTGSAARRAWSEQRAAPGSRLAPPPRPVGSPWRPLQALAAVPGEQSSALPLSSSVMGCANRGTAAAPHTPCLHTLHHFCSPPLGAL